MAGASDIIVSSVVNTSAHGRALGRQGFREMMHVTLAPVNGPISPPSGTRV